MYIHDFSIFVGGMLRVDPRERPTITDCLDRVGEVAEARQINLKEPLGLSEKVSIPLREPVEGMMPDFDCRLERAAGNGRWFPLYIERMAKTETLQLNLLLTI